MRKVSNKKGTIMLESIFCILAVLVVIIMLMAILLFMYQKAMFDIACNEAAEEFAHGYSKPLSDSWSSSLFKYTGATGASLLSAKKASLSTKVAARLTSTSLAKSNGNIIIDAEISNDDIGRKHFKVNFKKKYNYLFDDMLNNIGINTDRYLEKTVYLANVDMMHYKSCVDTHKYILSKLSSIPIIGTLSNAAIKFIHSITEYFA